MGIQKSMTIRGHKILKTGTGAILIDSNRTDLMTRGGKYYRVHLRLKNRSIKLGKVRKTKIVVEGEIKKFKGLEIEEVLVLLGLLPV